MACKGGVCSRGGGSRRRGPYVNPRPAPRSPIYAAAPNVVNNPTTMPASIPPTINGMPMANIRSDNPVYGATVPLDQKFPNQLPQIGGPILPQSAAMQNSMPQNPIPDSEHINDYLKSQGLPALNPPSLSSQPTQGSQNGIAALPTNQSPQQSPQYQQYSWYDPRHWWYRLFGNAQPTPEQIEYIKANPNGPAGLTTSNIPSTGQGYLNQILLGRDPQFLQFSPYSQNQQGALNQLLQMGLGGLQQSNISFEPIEQRARQQFNEQTIPSLAERFNVLSGGNTLRSSAFQTALGRQASDLESQLAALRSQHNLGLLPFYQNLATMGLTPQYESIYAPGGPGAVHAAARGVGQLLPLGVKMAGAHFGWPGF